MATATKNTNSTARKAAARKAGKCQRCGEAAKPGKSVVINYDKGTVSTVKSREGNAHYCADCAGKVHRRYEWKLTRRGSKSTTGKGSRKQAKRGTATKAKAQPKRKRTAKKATTKATPRKRTAAKASPKKVVKKGAGKRSKATQAAAEPF